MMSALLTVSDLAFNAWNDAIYRSARSISVPAKITTATKTKLVQIKAKLSAIALHPKMLDTRYAIDK